MEPGKKRLTLDLDAPLQRRLKAVAALKGISMRQYCQTAIEKELDEDEVAGVADESPRFSYSEYFAQVRKEVFGDRVLPGNSVDLLREAREIREAELRDVT